ncbi:putative colanic acid polymerase WcaD [Microbacterium xanthum]|uniref:putative colanic acid polymerase WcaD n=1 Tax=Microbacterium xanthum TaxID=3079794 RepID=UPI002AD24A2A|nr:putative colanic acid polymerase WcaD [Microbacterium sp. KSW-48]MDZ8170738.1 putative colanic acid polymerase WcaD [Microbacterium sp. KSW-48]
MNALFSGQDVGAGDFFGTFLLVVATVLLFALASQPPRITASQWQSVAKGLRFSVYVIAVLSVLQVIAGAAGSESFFNPWGDRQYLYRYQPLLQFNAVPRAHGFFLEPSFCAFVVGTVFFTLVVLRAVNWLVVVSVAATLAATRSATALALMLILLLVAAIMVRRARLFSLIAVVFLVLGVGEELHRRFTSIGDVSSSGNYRLLAPLPVLEDVLIHRPLGAPMGSVEETLSRYDLLNGAAVGTSLDNGFYLLIFYFGVVGIGFILALCLLAAIVFVRLRRLGLTLGALVPFWMLGSLAFSGGIFLPEYVLLNILLVLAIRHRLAGPTCATQPRIPSSPLSQSRFATRMA